MRKSKTRKISLAAFMLVALVAGCRDLDKNANAGNPSDPLTPPRVTSVTPPDGSTYHRGERHVRQCAGG